MSSPTPTPPSAFACAAPLRGAPPVAKLRGATCARRNAGARRMRGGERACALPPRSGDDVRAVGKARAAAVLARELPRMLSFPRGAGDTSGGKRELLSGGVGELFADNVEFEFPVHAGCGRKTLKMILMSLPLQANCGMLYPTVEGLVIASPSADSLVLNYKVRSSPMGEEAANASLGVKIRSFFFGFAEAELGPKATLVDVRTRLRFDDEGRIASWIDTWSKGVPEICRDLVAYLDPPEVVSSPDHMNSEHCASSGSRRSASGHGVTHLDQSSLEAGDVTDSSESAFHAEDWADEGEDKDNVEGNGWRPSDGDEGTVAGRRLANALVPSGPPLAPADARTAALRVADYLREEFGSFSLPGGGGANALDLSHYSLFHSDAVLETPSFVTEGADSLALLHAVARADTWFRFATARIVCVEARVEAPRVVVARYLMRARGRLGGGLVQKSSYVKLRLNTAGEIIHCEWSVDSVKDDCLPLFGRTKRWLWLG